MASKPLRCRLGMHSWEHRRNPEDGGTYLECRRCGRQGDELHLNDFGDPGGAGA